MQQKIILTALFILFCVLGLSAQTSIYVAPNSSGDGTSWQNASSIQDAILNASDNDTIKLREGIYSITTTLGIEQPLIILGGYSSTGNRNPDTYRSVLDGRNQESIMRLGYSSKGSIIEGVYFENGFGSNYAGALTIMGSEVMVLNCVFRNNASESPIGSSAIYIRENDVLIENTQFVGNQVIRKDDPDGNAGGTIHIRHINNTRIVNCQFLNNTSYYPGGAISSWGPNTSIENCIFTNNHSQSHGGAIYKNFDNLTIKDCAFTGNEAGENGGAVYNNNDPLELSKCVLKENLAVSNGGGLYGRFNEVKISKVYFEDNRASIHGGAIYCSAATMAIIDAVFWNNKAVNGGGAIYNSETLTLSNVNFIDNNNTAFLIGPSSSSTLYNSIFYNNTSMEGFPNSKPDITVEESAHPSLPSIAIVQNLLQESPAQGNHHDNLIGVDPLFIDLASGDFNLQHASPAVDAGKAMLYNSVSEVNAGNSEDLAGDSRLTASNIDLGAFEYHSILNCTQLSNPINNTTDVAINANLQWDAVEEATGYRISVGTTSGGTEIVSNLDLGNVTSYSHPGNFPEGTTIYVRVTPYNQAGDATACVEEEFTTETLLKNPACTTLSNPLDGSTDVAINTNLQWDAVEEATGYRISVGTTSGGTDIMNNLDLGNVTSYSHSGNLPEDATIYVRVIPYNEAGDAAACLEEQFTTETLLKNPACTTLSNPLDGSTDVAINTNLQWDAVEGATGYRISVGITSGGTEIVSNLDLGNVTSYSHSGNFPEGTTIYVRVTPYNQAGDATACVEEEFTTETLLKNPACTQLSNPINNTTNVAINTSLQWDAAEEATGYRISVGTTSGGTEIVSNLDLGNVTSYSHPGNFPEGTTIYVRVTPYNQAGDATACVEEEFTTETLLKKPTCTQLSNPINNTTDVAINTSLQWDAVEEAMGYRISVGTTSGGTEIVSNLDLGNVTSYPHTANFPEGTTIYVRVTPYNQAGDATACVEEEFTTTARRESHLLATQYGISPNGDGKNDFWEIEGIENFPNNLISVYNRWGNMVYQVQGYDNHAVSFRGIANKNTSMGGGRLPDGTYFFQIDIHSLGNSTTTKGFIVIKRSYD